MSVTDDNQLGTYLRDRRAKLDPKAFGIASERRRTPGLRREEVAQRANISATWYTWLEQGRGGVPSADVLDRMVVYNPATPDDVERIRSLIEAQAASSPSPSTAPADRQPEPGRQMEGAHQEIHRDHSA
jgi:transcriptional regulator with XRE-family HTH domain